MPRSHRAGTGALAWHGMVEVCEGMVWPRARAPHHHYNHCQCAFTPTPKTVASAYSTQHVQAKSGDKIKLKPSVSTGCIDGSTPMAWKGAPAAVASSMAWYGKGL